MGAIQVLRNADGGGVCQIFRKKALRRCKVQCYLRYEGVGGGPIFRRKKALRNTLMAPWEKETLSTESNIYGEKLKD